MKRICTGAVGRRVRLWVTDLIPGEMMSFIDFLNRQFIHHGPHNYPCYDMRN